MNKILKFVIILFLSNTIFGQNKEKVYVILDDNSFYQIIKKEDTATLEIPFYAYKDNWKNKKSKNIIENNDDLVKVQVIPSKKSYKFHSIKNPIKKSNIDGIVAFSVINVSKENDMVWKKYPYEMIFIEKIDCKDYLFWHMKPEFNE